MSIAILFIHCNNDPVTVNNFNRLKLFNPDKSIYPIGFKNKNLLENSFVVDQDQEYLPKNFIFDTSSHGRQWTEADLLIYDFVHHNELLHDKYLVIEWDTYCNCSIEEFYGTALNKETFGHTVHNPVEENWNWYVDLSQEQKNSILIFGGYTPTSGLLISKQILLNINQLILNNPRKYDNMFSELRLGSLIKIVGYALDIPFEGAEEYMNWKTDKIIFDKTKNGYYHPIKTIIN
jgi:hypothetical protein